tara:strand:+ start:441 stop:602 length:162 start_codon:yes stop_codon:yes gene_type:complete
MQKWQKILAIVRESMVFQHPMVEPQVTKVATGIAAALLTIAEVIHERDSDANE